MAQQHKKISENKTKVIAANANQGHNTVQLKDNRELSLVQRKLQEDKSPDNTVTQLIKRKFEESDDEDESSEENSSDEEELSDDEYSSSEEEETSDSDSDSSYEPPQPAEKQKRFHFPKNVTEEVIKQTAHRRVNVNKNFDEIYTCPACRRPLAYTKKGNKNLELTRFAFTSKGGNPHEQRALALDHNPPWAPRERALKAKNATDEEIKEDHNDPDRLRALCKVCNESHQYEGTSDIDYESDTDEEGYHTDTEEPENKGFYKGFRKDPDPGAGGSGVTA